MKNNETGKPLPESHESRTRIDSRELMREQRELIIAHGNEEYRLRVTSQGKLILTK